MPMAVSGKTPLRGGDVPGRGVGGGVEGLDRPSWGALALVKPFEREELVRTVRGLAGNIPFTAAPQSGRRDP